ncbi:uncharacterized protein LOC8072611 isoform X2 [Sorghum bicolor]|uniref:uncharacterized protein LOC8072611 isoform X2 n=1 Tax=Sorghum bicolor TaxID=4558 RepID=UPI000B426D43|nr:uncharacterized protein LOC8072611 isoform X2 [Sorghum bicolor]|eukprot:XP_021314197.1 uncharacterized protein LOC8072611 isoform X2 [Sorghum bicolor]
MSSPGPGSDDGVSAAAAAVVCCMCGDHGLPHELFRCNLCRLRTQHSDLYPRVAGPYRSCNWCLKQGGAAGGGDSRSPAKAPAAAAAGTRSRRINDSRGDDDDRDSDESAPCYGCSRSAFSADPGKPIKKPNKKGGRERAVQRPEEPVVTTTVVPKKRRREVQPGTPRFKAKVRRYKLLAEVTC